MELEYDFDAFDDFKSVVDTGVDGVSLTQMQPSPLQAHPSTLRSRKSTQESEKRSLTSAFVKLRHCPSNCGLKVTQVL